MGAATTEHEGPAAGAGPARKVPHKDVYRRMITYVRLLVCILCALLVAGPMCFFSGFYLIEEARTNQDSFVATYNNDVNIWTAHGARHTFSKLGFKIAASGPYAAGGGVVALTIDKTRDSLRQEPAHLTGYQALKFYTTTRLFSKVRVEGDTKRVTGKLKLTGSIDRVVHVDLYRKERVYMNKSDCEARKCHGQRQGGPVCHYQYDEATCEAACEDLDGVFTKKTRHCYRHEVLSGMCVKTAYDDQTNKWYVDHYGGGAGCFPATTLPGNFRVMKSGDVGLYKSIKPTAEAYDIDFSDTFLSVRSSYDPYIRLLWRQDESENAGGLSHEQMQDLGMLFLGVGLLLLMPCAAAAVVLCVLLGRRRSGGMRDIVADGDEEEESLLGGGGAVATGGGSDAPPPYQAGANDLIRVRVEQPGPAALHASTGLYGGLRNPTPVVVPVPSAPLSPTSFRPAPASPGGRNAKSAAAADALGQAVLASYSSPAAGGGSLV